MEQFNLIYIYRPQRSCEGYVFTRVCHSVHGGEVSASVHAGILPPPEDQAPPSRDQTPAQDQAPPWEQAPPGADTPGSRHPTPETATVADGMHPTGMHSCWSGDFAISVQKGTWTKTNPN